MSMMARDMRRAQIRRLLRFTRAAARLRETGNGLDFNVTLRSQLSAEGWVSEIVKVPDWTIVENLLAKFRPLYLDSEECSVRKVIGMLPSHLPAARHSEIGKHADRWNFLLQATTAPIPAGSKIAGLVPGYDAIAQTEGRMEILFDSELLTGREAIDLSLYGELTHIDAAKERKLLKIRASSLAAGYVAALVGVLCTLLGVVENLRKLVGQALSAIPEAEIEDIEANP